MKTELVSAVNWEVGSSPVSLKSIHSKDINIAIYERDTQALRDEINTLLKQDIEVRASGDIDTILNEVLKEINPNQYGRLIQDIKELLSYFTAITDGTKMRLLLATINGNMCRKFHTDINDLRMLCTYSGPGTLWLTEDNINRTALDAFDENERIVIEESRIRQAQTGSVVLLKGAIYPQEGTKAVVHRSPTIEESGQKRLLLRIDTNGPFSS